MRIAIDTGGTFTDCLFVRAGRLEILKVPSTPRNPAQAIGEALKKILSGTTIAEPQSLDLTCGTTVGTNAVLERRGGRVALVTTAGFEDVIEIGRQARPRLYDFLVERPPPLVLRERRFGLRERIGADGRVLVRLSLGEIARIVRRVTKCGADSVALCLLFSFQHPRHEQMAARRLRAAGLPVSVSCEILPEFREFERTSTTVVNAYLVPVMSRYLEEMEALATREISTRRPREKTQVRVMQSSGGIMSARAAAREPVRTILSGPAGGVLGAQYVAERAGFSGIISFDMGGTSTDVALVESELRTTNESSISGLPVAVPMLDIHTVGAGGGSIARFDRGGALRVGPESVGADPGPIAYGRGEQPAVTDAHLVLGRLGAEGLLGGEFRLDEQRVREWMGRLLRIQRSRIAVEQFAQGVLDVADATMERAIRVISVERGYDPRDYTLVAFGGAGGMHACGLAAALDMRRVLIPKLPGALSALGILRADVTKDFSHTILLAAPTVGGVAAALRRAFAPLEVRGMREMCSEGFAARRVRIERLLDVRYVGQAYELTVPAAGDFLKYFHRQHERLYGYADAARPVEVVNVRARLIGATPKPELPRSKIAKAECRGAIASVRRVFFGGRAVSTRLYDRTRLRAGNRFSGPAIVAEYSATTVVPPGWRARLDAFENILMTRAS
jgi:N-methylhydantoinase A